MPKSLTNIFVVILLLCCRLITQAQVAGFTVDHTTGCTPLIVHFTNTSSGATNYSWNFGNTATSFLPDPSTSYLTAGTYTVTLTAFNGALSNTTTTVITVYPLPTVGFSAADTTLCPGIATLFTNTASANMPGGLTYNWNFGDGSTSPTSSTLHSYPLPGNYNITLFATNTAGCTNSLSKDAYVHVFPVVTAGFNSATTYFCKAPAAVHFNNTTTGPGPVSYSWTFGDAGTSLATAPNHTYAASGSYDVTLKATDINGCVDSAAMLNYINIGNLTAAFTPVANGCVGVDVAFTNTSGPHISTDWRFGDGGTSTDESPTHSYSTPGVRNVRLIVFNGLCYDTVVHTINVHANPVGSFTITPAVPCPLPATITYAATAPAGTTVTWQLMDTITATGNTVSHSYSATDELIDTVVMTMTDAFGCRTSLYKLDSLFSMSVDVSASNTVGCIPLSTVFSALPNVLTYNPLTMETISVPSPYTITGYSWNFGDGSPVVTGPTPAHTYTAVGVYIVACTLTTSSGCTKAGSITIKTGIPPVATFSATPTQLCAGQKVTFSGSVTGTYDAIKWVYGDDLDSPSTTHVIHKYATPGVDTAKLYVYAHGCRNVVIPRLPILVDSPGAIWGFNYTCIPNNGISFFSMSPGASSQKWYFGDGDSSSLNSPVHYFPSLSAFSTTLITSNSTTGCKDTVAKVVDLTPPFLYFYALDTSICKDQAATFISFIITASGGPAMARYWRVDGNLADTTVDIFTYPAHSPGLHDVSLVVRDDRSCLDTFYRNNYLLVGDPLDSFTLSPATGCGPLNVTFNDFSKGLPAAGAPLISYSWSFGDGTNSVSGTAGTSHTFPVAGNYTVSETIIDNIGCSASYTSPTTIIVYRPTAAFSSDKTHVCKGENVHFLNTSASSTSYFWMFGDGSTSTVASPYHVYTASGSYSVLLAASESHGCTDTLRLTAYITVDPSPVASFTQSDSFAVCPPLNVAFTNLSTGAVLYNWSFGNGAFSVAFSPTNPYTLPGYYTIRLVATNGLGCTDTAYHHASVFGYTGAFSYLPLGGCAPLPVHFNVSLGSISTIVWDFSDGATSSGLLTDTISHTYTVPGTYVPKLILTDSSGCLAFSYGADTIKVDTLTPDFTINPNPVCQNSDASFLDASHANFSTPAAWLWTFASGATSTLAAPAYAYTTSGTLPVTLQVTSASGCTRSVTKTVSVNPLPAAITGNMTVCPGLTTTLSTLATGGTWSCAATTVATVSPTGVVSGISLGTAAITYTLPTGCLTTAVVTVYALPAPITGPTNVCAGLTATLSCATAGGTWTSSDASIAAITPTSGNLTGSSAGVATITYALGTGCITTRDFTVNPVPVTITGTMVVCEGLTTNLTEAVTGGSWSSGSPAVATVDAAGAVAGIAAGTTLITYGFATGCLITTAVTVNAVPAPITGILEICQGFSTTLTEPTTGGAWSSSIPGIASVTTAGLVNGLIDGVTTIAYTLPTGCKQSVNFTVNPLPATITGTLDICVASSATLSNAFPGGTWSSADPSIAVAGSLSGIVTGVSAGTTYISYILSTGCIATTVMTVEVLPPPIDPPLKVCAGFAENLTDGLPGGTWTADPLAAGIGTIHHITGVITGITGGTVTVTYTVSTGCAVTGIVTVNTLPPPISGSPQVCVGAVTTLSEPGAPSGTWSSSNTSVAAVDASSGVVTGITPGNAVISYFISTGCFNVLHVTVNPLPLPITGTPTVCRGATTTLHNATPLGIWLSDYTDTATVVYNTGVVTGVHAGTATISYALVTGCFAAKVVTVYPTPAAITGNANICMASVIPFADATTGGTWSSSNTSVATIGSATGIAVPITLGTTTISYTVPLGNCFATRPVTVQPLPLVYHVTGGGSYCAGGNGVHIGLDGSQSGISYLLYYGSSATGYMVGSGLPIDFGLLAPAGLYTVRATNATTGCIRDMAGSASVIVTMPVPPTVTISTGGTYNSCPGAVVSMAPVTTSAGTAPAYLWSVNGVNVSTADNYSFVPADGDVVSLQLTSNGYCISSTTAVTSITLHVLPFELPAVAVSVNPGDTICQFNLATYTAVPAWGGASPAFTWLVNGIVAATGPVYTYPPVHGDLVRVRMVSNYLCRLADAVMSSDVPMTVDSIRVPHVFITTDSGFVTTVGDPVKLRATANDAGPDPLYQWKVNGHPVAGATADSFSYIFRDYDSVNCVVISSGACHNIGTFDWVFISVFPLGVTPNNSGGNEIALVPNPNNGTFTLRGSWHNAANETGMIEITDLLGQVVYSGGIAITNDNIDQQIMLDNSLANGMYLLNITVAGERATMHFVVSR